MATELETAAVDYYKAKEEVDRIRFWIDYKEKELVSLGEELGMADIALRGAMKALAAASCEMAAA